MQRRNKNFQGQNQVIDQDLEVKQIKKFKKSIKDFKKMKITWTKRI